MKTYHVRADAYMISHVGAGLRFTFQCLIIAIP